MICTAANKTAIGRMDKMTAAKRCQIVPRSKTAGAKASGSTEIIAAMTWRLIERSSLRQRVKYLLVKYNKARLQQNMISNRRAFLSGEIFMASAQRPV